MNALKKLLIFAPAALTGFSLFAAAPLAVGDVTVTPISPFGLAIDYTVSDVQLGAVWYAPHVTLTLADGTTTHVARTLTGDTTATAGVHRIYWNLAKDGISSFTGATVSVTYKDKVMIDEPKKVEGDGAAYCVIDLSGGPDAASYPLKFLDAESTGGFNTEEYKKDKLVLKRIEAGTFVMGDDQSSADALANHKVTLTQPFYMALFETTQMQWERVTGEKPSWSIDEAYLPKWPVERVSYTDIRGETDGERWPTDNKVDATSFLGKLRARTGLNFDLPTEAQWEYACRAGSKTAFSYGGVANGDYMWFSDNSDIKTHEVGTKSPNKWGLYDMHGNVGEWCLDASGSPLPYGVDPKGSPLWDKRVLRGGSFNKAAADCMSFVRHQDSPNTVGGEVGFRLSRTMPAAPVTPATAANVSASVIKDGAAVEAAIRFDYLGKAASPVSIIQTAEGGAGDKTEIVGGKTSDGAQSWQPSKPGEYKYEYIVGSEPVLSATYTRKKTMSFSDATLASFNYSGTYDGSAHGIALTNGCDALKGISGATVAYTTVEADIAADRYEAANPTFKNAGTRTVFYRIVADGYAPYRGSATVEIKPRAVTVNVAGKQSWPVYDGEEKSVNGYDIAADDDENLYDVMTDTKFRGEPIASSYPTISRTDVGETKMGLKKTDFTNANGNFEVFYNLHWDGKLEITPLDISGAGEWVCELGASHTYDGTVWTQGVASATFKKTGTSTALAVTYELTGNKQTNAGAYQMTLAGKGNFTGTRTIDWSIGRRPLKLTSASKERVYDGTALKAGGVTEDGFVDGEGATYVLNNSQTNFGESKNVIGDINWNAGTSASNYDVTKHDGTLTVTKRKVTITSESNTNLVYNGKDQTYEVITIGGQGFVAGEGIVTSNWATVATVSKGVIDNTFSYDFAAGTRPDNYAVTVAYGKIKIVPKTLTAGMFSLVGVPEGGYVWDGTAKTPDVSCQDGSSSIIGNDDFTVSYSNNVEVGTATVTFTGKNNYKGTVKKFFTIGELYADVTFDALGGKVGAAKSVTLKQSHRKYDNLPAAPTRENYTFEGWYRGVANGAAKAAANGAWLATGDHTLYAKWTVDPAVLPGAADGVFAYTNNVDGTVTITGFGRVAMRGTSLVIPDMIDGKFVTEIGAGAFANSTKGITSVTLPMFLEKIGRRAFSGVKTLASVTFASVRKWRDPSVAGTLTIDPYAFTSTALTGVRLPQEVVAVGEYAFADCRSLVEVTILGRPTVGTRPFRRAGIDAGRRPVIHLDPELAANTAYLSKLTNGFGDASLPPATRTSAIVDSVSVGTLSVAPGAVRLSVAVGRAADWGQVAASRIRVEYRESLGDAPTTLTPRAVTPQADGTLAVEVAAPAGASGFFRVKVEE